MWNLNISMKPSTFHICLEKALAIFDWRLLRMVDGLNFKEFVSFLSTFSARASLQQKIELIFKVYDIDGKGKVSFKDLVEILRDLTGSSMSEKQREELQAYFFGV
ncbi:calcineurin subunit B-like isoform X2 [Triticum urartu]|uniref:calcineurin subunit B-like isoform X2 n=1 Tax=Triticum urartu TaxID=4572 RepID=UPI0020441C11|nr:calcineurin subunit B-like isoform X2 [Triticum urartu]